MDLITLQDYKSYKGIPANKTEDDAKNSLFIGYVSALIQTYLGITESMTPGSYTETISLDYETDKIYLEKYPIADVTSITSSNVYTYDSTVHVPLVYASDYLVDKDNGILIRQYVTGGFANWPISPGNVIVSYTTPGSSGSGSNSIPSDLKLATILLIDYYKDDGFRQSRSIQGTSQINVVGQSTDFPKHIQVILDKYNSQGYKYN